MTESWQMDVDGFLEASRVGGRHRRALAGLSDTGSAHLRTTSMLTVQSGFINSRPSRAWTLFVYAVTFWIPSCILKYCGMGDRSIRKAFREKLALCLIILLMCAALAFFTFGMGMLLCPPWAHSKKIIWRDQTSDSIYTWAFGNVYLADEVASTFNLTTAETKNDDIGRFFSAPQQSLCNPLTLLPERASCRGSCIDRGLLEQLPVKFLLAYQWTDIESNPNLYVYNGQVIFLPKLSENVFPLFKDPAFDRLLLSRTSPELTRSFGRLGWNGKHAALCLLERYKVGQLSRETTGCFIYNVFQVIALVIIGSLIIVRFLLSVAFSWFMSRSLDQMRKKNTTTETQGYPAEDHPSQDGILMTSLNASLGVNCLSSSASNSLSAKNVDDPFVILLVTCYSESEESLRLTLDSLANTDYHDQRKLIFIVADGFVTGAGNALSTPEIAINLLHFEHRPFRSPVPQAYCAVADDIRRHNMAKVYAGHYRTRGRSVSCILVAKCGSPLEQNGPKPGNRGKRDSQLILMNFMQRVTFNDRMAPLDFDMFNKIFWLMGHPADVFEIILMVDADTNVAIDSLPRMVDAMRRDPMVMGLCGETRIANKTASWVSAIQVFEYFISHHHGKAFESVFGGVTCLPGCFCMYRLKAQQEGRTIPILVSPAVIDEYSQATVESLHEKNLLLLGEDRFLTTLMLKLFPRRKMIFVPRAYCKTFVPDEFRVLLSQRRRWINSTIHNLMELVLVPNLCGIFCFSMQFVIFMELVGTVVLPAAIVFTYVLIATAFMNPANAIIPLILLGMILGLPAVLILITTRKLSYIGWMMVYLLALPIWNFVLPVYAYWHFDDFSWGQTRKIDGLDTATHDGEVQVQVGRDITDIPMNTWIAWTKQFIEKDNNH